VVKELSQKDIAQIYDIMGVLEGLAVRIATPVIADEDIAKIEDLVVQMEENKDNKFLLSHYNLEFHNLLTRFGGNYRLINFMENIRAQTYRMRLQTFYNEEQVRASLREHRAILKAIQERRPQRAENLVRKHFLDAKDRLIKFINSTL
jgi:DNA-binding GntR family transcriptional regulator